MKHTLTLLIVVSLFATCHAQHASKTTSLQTRVVASAVTGGEGNESEDWPPERKVFAHHVPWHPPSHARPDRTADAAPGLESQIAHAAAAGIDGFAVDVVRQPPSQMVGMLVDMAGIAQRRAPDFAIMPCLDCDSIQSVDDWDTFLDEWLCRAGEMAATYRMNGAPVVFTYGAYEMPPADWDELRQRLRKAGHALFLIGEMNGLYRNEKNPLPRIREYADVFDGLYFFAPNTEEHERKLLGIERSDGRPLLRVFSPSPGYWRVNTGSFARPFQGTRTYQSQWDLACKLPVHWASITTWNDYTEHTHVEPARNSTDAYARLTRIGAARFRGEPPEPVTGPETFWLTAPAEMPDGPGPAPLEADTQRETVFEVLRVGPPSTEPSKVSVSIARPGEEVIAERQFEIDAGKPVADWQFRWQPDRKFGEPYLVVTASVGELGARLPLPLWPSSAARRYHMAPRRARLVAHHPPKPVISLDGVKMTVSTLPGEAGWRTDLLHNLLPMLDPKSRTSRVAEGVTQLPGTEPGWGFWEVATVTPDARVAWADPIFIPPRGDLTTLALYRFDDPDDPMADQSIYARHGRLRGRLAELADGNHALACDSESWFEPSGSFCPANSPLTVELWVRPEKPGGTLWGDVGVAMALSLTPEGKPVARRRQSSDEKRIATQGEEPVENGKWSHLAGVFDGRSLNLYRNGDLVAQAPCKGASGSSRMAIGRNPYDMTSIFTGLIDDVRVTARALKPSEFGPVNPAGERPAPPALIK